MSTETWAPVGDRIRRRLDQLGMAQTQLIEALCAAGVESIDKSKLSRSLSGKRQLTSREIAYISEAIALDPYFLATGTHPSYEPRVAARHDYLEGEHVANWSECLRMIQPVSRAYSEASLVGDGKLARVRRELNAPEGTPGSYGPGRELARKLRERWENSEFTSIVMELPEFLESELGIELAIIDGIETDRVKAQAFSVQANAVIVVVQSGSWYSAAFAVLHEVAHLLFDDLEIHDPGVPFTARDSEIYANAFAADFLLPMKAMSLFVTESPSSFAKVAWEHGVGADFIGRRASSTQTKLAFCPTQVTLNRLFVEEFGRENLEARRAKWRTPRFPSRLVSAHSEGVENRLIAPGSLAWMIGVPVEELRPKSDVTDLEAAESLLELL